VSETVAEQPAAVSRQIVAGWSVFSIDIESNPADGDRIFKIGAVRSDAEVVVSLSTGRMVARDVVRRVDDAAQGARVLVGHNLRRHDVPLLRRQYPGSPSRQTLTTGSSRATSCCLIRGTIPSRTRG
jgi:ATP-dependent DNA helicase RecQ